MIKAGEQLVAPVKGVGRYFSFAAKVILVGVLVIVVPELLGLIMGSTAYAYRLMTAVAIMGLFGLGLNVVYGYTGMVSFGHAALFGGGSYAVAILVGRFGVTSWALTLLVATLAGGVLGMIMGVLVGRSRGVAVVLITFALAQVLWLVSYLDPLGLTGGEGGIPGLHRQAISLGPVGLPVDGPGGYYGFVVIILIVCSVVLHKIIEGPLGLVMRAIRDDEQRTVTLGYNIFQYKILAFLMSGLVSGLAGGLWAYLNGIVTPENLHWLISGDALLLIVLGGQAVFLGPIVGAALVVIAHAVLSNVLVSWPLVLGLIYVLVVIFLPDGIYVWFRDNYQKLIKRMT